MLLFLWFTQFSTWGDAEGKWFYDCENDGNGNRLSPIEPILTGYQRLQKFLLKDQQYDPEICPKDLDVVMFDFDLLNANYMAKKSFMEIHGRFKAVNRLF